ncbi:class II fructose-bisphosphate aldolase [Candidatus Wolfebacteria bacterium]|nr:class II fructose-bisphosphate aldolase [Candidatus Wolfebacteria bacterium]
MKTLKQYIIEAEKNKIAIGHFNVSDLSALKAIFEKSREFNLPIIIGVSEGERNFIGTKQIAVLIKSLREEYNYPIFLNADHTKSLEKVKEAAEAGFDAILFDAGEMKLEDNIKETKKAIEIIKNINSEILIEAELGYIGGSSSLLKSLPPGAAIKTEDLTMAEDAACFVRETGVDLLAPAIGNIHGIISSGNPKLNIERIVEIKKEVNVSLVLHGGSGILDNEVSAAIDAGVSIVHINTELRLAWRKGLENSLKENSEEISPYKILPGAVEEIKKVVEKKLKLFNKL